ncbi:MAG: hypothetical protein JWP34_2970, partial [Massilia sp.]|nr:hypothetical protein [Massilia sp.]
HLNQLFDYLGEQERLTRANLIGIGIVCGLALRRGLGASEVRVTRGCGITSAGYLIVEPDDVVLVAYRKYTLPLEVNYPPLRDQATELHPQFELWEMFKDGEPDTTPLGTPDGFLDDKAVLLFLELKQEGLRNCSPNDCNDRGSQVTATVRRLLIRTSDLDKVIAGAASAGNAVSESGLSTALSERLKLPDLRLLRFDVPNTGPATSEQVLAAFQAVFRTDALAAKTGAALGAAWQAFRPLLQHEYPNDPFAGFGARFGFLDSAAQTTGQVLFLQYYYDFFDDLILAYDEFRWKGAELLCACCPSDQLFPRHLMLGVLLPASVADPALYRHGFAPACAGEELVGGVLLLFRRLAGMVQSFTDQPPLPQLPPSSKRPVFDPQLRITPSAAGAHRLADMALPYYYQLKMEGAAPLHQVWSPQRTRRGRANQNLGYRSGEYQPAPPRFVLEPLAYDMAPYDFLRIEGHLGKNVDAVLPTLLGFKQLFRLPVDIIALRTGAFDETIAAGAARFQDLETLYDTLREELLCTLCEGVRYLYGVVTGVDLPGGVAKLPLLAKHAPGFVYGPNTVGAWYEKNLASLQARPYIDPDQNKIDAGAVLMVYCVLFANTSPPLPQQFFAHVVSVYYLSKLSDALPDSLDALAYADFENKYQDLIALTRFLRGDVASKVGADLQQYIPAEELIDHFDQVLYSCRLDPMKVLHDEFLRRVREVKNKLFLAPFLQTNPGIQHKAGVPLGGTFILVYHGEPAQRPPIAPQLDIKDFPGAVLGELAVFSGALERIGSNKLLALDPDVRMLLSTLTGRVPPLAEAALPAEEDPAGAIIREAVDTLAVGAVVADFFLPYLYSADSPALQYVLPLPPLGLQVALSCTDAAGNAEGTLTPSGGLAPISYQLDGQPWAPLDGPVLLSSGPHTVAIRDSAGSASAPQAIIVPAKLRTEAPTFTDNQETMTYTVTFLVSGGTLPYAADSGAIEFNQYTSAPVDSGTPLKVVITDAAGCQTSTEVTHTVPSKCDLPCDGFARRCGYRFWLPEPDSERPFDRTGVKTEVGTFRIEAAPGKMVELGSDVAAILRADGVSLNGGFDKVATKWIDQINRLLAKATGSTDAFVLTYERGQSGMAVLWIERFECLDFEFDVHTFFSRRGIGEEVGLRHTPKGSTWQLQVPAAIPPFDCSRIAKCDPARPVTQLCKELDMQLKIDVSLDGGINVSATAAGADKPVLFLWEVQDCNPPVATGQRVAFAIQQRTPFDKLIRLSAFTKDGCMQVALRRINIG